MDVVNRDSVTAFVTKDTSTIREILAPRNSSALRQSLAEAIVDVGRETQAHSHPHTEEFYYILRGAGLMAIEAELSTVEAGDAVCIPAGQRHQIRSTGQEPLVFLCCCVPAYTDEDTALCDSLL